MFLNTNLKSALNILSKSVQYFPVIYKYIPTIQNGQLVNFDKAAIST